MTTHLKIIGMHCASCKTLIEEVARESAGVTGCEVDLAAGTARIDHDTPEALAAAVRGLEALGEYGIETV